MRRVPDEIKPFEPAPKPSKAVERAADKHLAAYLEKRQHRPRRPVHQLKDKTLEAIRQAFITKKTNTQVCRSCGVRMHTKKRGRFLPAFTKMPATRTGFAPDCRKCHADEVLNNYYVGAYGDVEAYRESKRKGKS